MEGAPRKSPPRSFSHTPIAASLAHWRLHWTPFLSLLTLQLLGTSLRFELVLTVFAPAVAFELWLLFCRDPHRQFEPVVRALHRELPWFHGEAATWLLPAQVAELRRALEFRSIPLHVLDGASIRSATELEGEFPRGGALGYPKRTDANGWIAFTKRLLPAGETKLYAGTDGFELLDGKIRIEPTPAVNEFVLHAAQRRSIRGHVFTPDGRPCSEVEIEAVVSGTSPFPMRLGLGRSLADGSFELFQQAGGDEPVSIRGSEWSSHEVLDAGPPHAWGASGVRVVMMARLPIQLQVVCAEDDSPVERFAVDLSRRTLDGKGESSTSNVLSDRPAGRVDLGRLAKGVRVEVWPEDPMLAPVDLIVDEAHRDQKEIRVHVHRLVPFQLTLSDPRGAPLATECWLLERCGAQLGDGFLDYRANRHQAGGRSTLRVSTATTDANGKATLMAPVTTRELVLEVRSGKQKHWLPVQPSKAVKTLRLVVPD